MFYKILSWYLISFITNIEFSNSQFGAYKLCVDKREISDRVCLALHKGNSYVSCILVEDSVDCAIKIQNGEADFGLFTAEEALLAQNFINDNVQVIGQLRHRDKLNDSFAFHTVAVVKGNFDGDFANLSGKNYCHPGFDLGQTWTDRVLKEFENSVVPRVHRPTYSNVDNELYSISRFFNTACRPGRWSMDELMDNKLKQKYSSLCKLCDFDNDQCTYSNEVHGTHKSALNCLTRHDGDVAYVALQYAQEYFGLIPGYREEADRTEYKFLCPSGQTSPLNVPCSWVKQPWTSVVASRDKSTALSGLIPQWLNKERSGRGNWEEVFRNIMEGPDYIFQPISGPKTLISYTQEGRAIPMGWDDDLHRRVTMCVPGQKLAFEKCTWLKQSIITHGIEPELSCKEANSVVQCLELVGNKSADIVNIDTDYGFLARKLFNLSTVVYEDGAVPDGNYLIIAVIKNHTQNITYDFATLRGKKACFPSHNGIAWLSVTNILKTSSLLPAKCPYNEATASFFGEICAPNFADNLSTLSYCNLCKVNNTSHNKSCKFDAIRKYSTDIGALSCLKELGADVAFVDYYRTFVEPNKLLSNNVSVNDFKILCKNGTIIQYASVDEECALSYGTRAEILGRKFRSKVEQIDYTELLLKIDAWMGGTIYSNVMDIYASFRRTKDVLFKESTLNMVPSHDHNYNYIESYSELQTSLNETCVHKNGAAFSVRGPAFVLLAPIAVVISALIMR